MRSQKLEMGSDRRKTPSHFPDEVLDSVLAFVDSNTDRNSLSLVCKAWFKADSRSRRKVFVGNCYAVTPQQVIRRFPQMDSLTIKGRPHFSDFGLVPQSWGGSIHPWIVALAQACPKMEEFRLKRMTISDEILSSIPSSFPNFQSLVLIRCDGFSSDGLAHIVSSCPNLARLDLEENEIVDTGRSWLGCFPDTHTSLRSLDIATVDSAAHTDFDVLESLVARSKNLQRLKLHRSISSGQLQRLLLRAPQLIQLGTGSYSQIEEARFAELQCAFRGCKALRSLSGFWDMESSYASSLYPITSALTSLDLSRVQIDSHEFVNLIAFCQDLDTLTIQDCVHDEGVQSVAMHCKKLQELRVYPSSLEGPGYATELGLVAIAEGCSKLKKILYFCSQMTNAAMETFSLNLPDVTHFRLCMERLNQQDPITNQPMDSGFGAIVMNCKNLQRLSVSGSLTDKVFEVIGSYGKNLRFLSLAFVGKSYKTMEYLLNGCTKLRKLEVRDCPVGDEGLLANIQRFEHMRSLWMSKCDVSLTGAYMLAQLMPNLNVEIISDHGDVAIVADISAAADLDCAVNKLYVYRTLAGPRTDAPNFVENLNIFRVRH